MRLIHNIVINGWQLALTLIASIFLERLSERIINGKRYKEF